MSIFLLGNNLLDKRNLSRILERLFIFICFLGYTIGIWFYLKSYYEMPGTMEDTKYAISTNGAVLTDNSDADIRLSFPPDNYISSSAVTPDLVYTWKNPSSYPVVFQIALHSDFAKEMIVDERLSGTAVQGRFLPPGTYYWRVLREEGNPAFTGSQPMRLVVLPSFNAPEILTPKEGENLRITEGIPVDFKWEKLNYADSYDFKLYSVGNKVPLYEVSSLGDTVVQAYFSTHTVGKYRWTVQADIDSLGGITRKRGLTKDHFFSIGPSGAARVPGFVRGVIKAGAVNAPITLLTPWIGSSFMYTPLSPPVVRWSADDNFINTRVIFSRDQDPASDSRAIIQYVADGETSIDLPALNEGIWYWIVQGETLGGQGFSAASPSWFTIQPQSPLDSPRYIQPAQDAVFTLEQLTSDRKITFIWEEVPDADAYIFSVFDAEKKKLLYSTSPIHDTSFELTDLALLSIDGYTWQVEAVSMARNGTIERRGIIQQSSFTVQVTHSEDLRTTSQGSVYGY